MTYPEYSYLYPPRPEQAIPPAMLGFYESKGFIAQAKKNGVCSVLAISPEREVIAMTRHHEPHRMWSPSHLTCEAFLGLTGGWYVFVAELLHSKGPLRDTNYINDLLVADGELLVGETFADRQNRLSGLFPDAVEHISGGYRVIDAHTWLATCHASGFRDLYHRMENRHQGEDEGIVIKNPRAQLEHCYSAKSNSAWMVKCRFPTRNYSF